MKKLFTLFAFLSIFAAGNLKAQSPSPMYTVSPYADSLWTVDTTTWTTNLPGIAITLPGSTVTGFNGLSVQPGTGVFYIIAKVSGVTGRMLCTLDIVTGVLTPVGNTGENIANMDFVNQTTLVGLSGDGGNSGETFYFIDITTAALTAIGSSTAGSDGESMAYCPDDGFVYRWSGRNTNNVMERWDYTAGTFTNIPISGFDFDEIFGSTYIGDGKFLLANLDQEYLTIDTTGFCVDLGFSTANNWWKGMVFESRSVYFVGGDSICPLGDSTMAVAYSGLNPTAFQWNLNGSPIAGATNDTIWVSQFGNYTCDITDSECTVPCPTGPITLNAFLVDTAFVSPLAGVMCVGDSIQLDGVASDSSQWWFGGNTISTDTFAWAPNPGMYVYRLFSNNGCYDEATLPVTHDSIWVSVVGTDLLCIGDDSTGVAMSTVTGGMGTVTYQWNTGETGMNETSLAIGTAIVTVTDSLGCTASDSVNIAEPTLVMANATGTDVLCFGGTDGTGVLAPSGGTPGYIIDWMGADSTNLSTGTHIFTVTDANGCMITDSVTIGEPTALALSATSTDELLGNDGTIDLTVSGGTAGYTYVWMPSGTGEDPSGLAAGTYTVTVTDANGCTDTLSVTVGSQVGISEFGKDAIMNIYPNPNTGHFFMSFENVDYSELTVEVYNAVGQLVTTQSVNQNPVEIDIRAFGAGMYTVKIKDGTRQAARQIIVK